MANLINTLKDEISRIARKEYKLNSEKLRSDYIKIRSELSSLKKEIAALKKETKSKHIVTSKSTPAKRGRKPAAEKAATEKPATGARIRPNGSKVTALRTKFGMSQDEFAKLLNIGRITVCRWEKTEGTIRFKGEAIRQKLAEAMKIGKKEAWGRIGGKPQNSPRRGRRKAQ